MALSTVVIETEPRDVGNAIVLGSQNNTYYDSIDLDRWQFVPLTEQDYQAGSRQFLHLITFNVTVDPLSGLGFTNSNPLRQRYGELTINNLNDDVIATHVLEYKRQQIQFLGARHLLPRQESSRPKQYELSARPRFLLSNSTRVQFPVSGIFTTTGGTYSGAGIIAGAAPGTFTENGSYFPTASTVLPLLTIERRTLPLDVTDGRLSLTQSESPLNYFTYSAQNGNNERWLPGSASFYLLPGAVGTVTTSIIRLSEPGDAGTNQVPPYNGPITFPPL